jgi:hypothetical protein
MFKLFFIYLLLIHILGDYYFQTSKLAVEKNQSAVKQLVHGLIYLVISIIFILPVFNLSMLLAILVLSASHLLIDFVKYSYIHNELKDQCPPEKERSIYLVDQLLHLICIFIIAFVLVLNNTEVSVLPMVVKALEIIEIPFGTLLSWGSILLLIWKPANITIKQLLCLNRPNDEEDAKKSGGFIGLLERLIILVFLSINQYSAIGLVLTAKSIARYDEIAHDRNFAEYYLLGTLLSTAIAIIAYLIIL